MKKKTDLKLLQILQQLPDPDFLVTTEVGAQALALSQKTMREWAKPGGRGPISPTRIGGAVRWRWSEIQKLMQEGDAIVAAAAAAHPSPEQSTDAGVPAKKRRGRPRKAEQMRKQEAA